VADECVEIRSAHDTLRRWSRSRPRLSRTAASISVSALPGRPEAKVPVPSA
jgi:hypothetical protein